MLTTLEEGAAGSLPLTEQHTITCFSADLTHANLKTGEQVTVTGSYTETPFPGSDGKERLKRQLDVAKLAMLAPPAIYETGFEPIAPNKAIPF